MRKINWINFSILVLFMSWICLFIFYGPLFSKMVMRSLNNPNEAKTVIIAVFYIVISIFTFLIKSGNVKKLMDIGLIASICVSFLMWFRPETQSFYLGYIFLGTAAGIATTSYSYIYIYGFTPESRLKYTALYLCVLYLGSMILGYAASLMGDNGAFFLITLLPVSVFILNRKFTVESLVSPDFIPKRPFPKKLMLLMGAVIFLAYFNAGIEANIYNMGENIVSTISDNITQATVLLSIFFLSGRINKFSLVYCGFIIKGISYVLYIIAGGASSLTTTIWSYCPLRQLNFLTFV